MEIQKINHKTVKMIPKGSIDIITSFEIKDHLLNQLNDGNRFIIIDFSEITCIDTSGVGVLLRFQRKLKGYYGNLSIINVRQPYIMIMFKMLQIENVIEVNYSYMEKETREYAIWE